MQRNGSSNNSMWMKRSILELITAQQHLSSRAFCAVITTIAFGFIDKKKRAGMTKQASATFLRAMYGIKYAALYAK